jgi:hypothetical protein
VGAAGLITGGVLLGLAQAKANEVEKAQGETYDSDVHDAMLEDGRTFERAGWVVGAVGAAAVAVGVTLLLLSDNPEEPEEPEEAGDQPADDTAATVGLAPLRGGVALGARWSF